MKLTIKGIIEKLLSINENRLYLKFFSKKILFELNINFSETEEHNYIYNHISLKSTKINKILFSKKNAWFDDLEELEKILNENNMIEDLWEALFLFKEKEIIKINSYFLFRIKNKKEQ